MKGVVVYPSLQDLHNIGHEFTDETLQKVEIGGGDFLPLEDKRCLRVMGRLLPSHLAK